MSMMPRCATLLTLAWYCSAWVQGLRRSGLDAFDAACDIWLIYHWLGENDISEALAITQACRLDWNTMFAYLGSRLRGWPGAIVAVTAYYRARCHADDGGGGRHLLMPDRPVNGSPGSVQIGVVGLLAASMWRLSRSAAKASAEGGTVGRLRARFLVPASRGDWSGRGRALIATEPRDG
jgi:hypothetical protein